MFVNHSDWFDHACRNARLRECCSLFRHRVGPLCSSWTRDFVRLRHQVLLLSSISLRLRLVYPGSYVYCWSQVLCDAFWLWSPLKSIAIVSQINYFWRRPYRNLVKVQLFWKSRLWNVKKKLMELLLSSPWNHWWLMLFLWNRCRMSSFRVVPMNSLQIHRLLLSSFSKVLMSFLWTRCKTNDFWCCLHKKTCVVSLSMTVAPKWSECTYFCQCVCVRIDIRVCLFDRGSSDSDMSRRCPLSVQRIKLIFLSKDCHQNMCPDNSSIEKHTSQWSAIYQKMNSLIHHQLQNFVLYKRSNIHIEIFTSEKMT